MSTFKKEIPAILPSTRFDQFAYAYGEPNYQAILKSVPEDFMVEEKIAFELTGEGEHLWCWVEKRGENTDWVAGMLAKWANTTKRNVGFAGQKDRNAVTRQWFSIQLPGKADPDPEMLELDGVKILQMQRHNRKLQRGGLSANRFDIVLRDIVALGQADNTLLPIDIQADLEKRLQAIAKEGVPNYFGEQRFGKQANNLKEGEKLLLQDQNTKGERKRRGSKKGNRNQQSLYISALRSWMFNDLLSTRIKQGTWNQAIEGDVLQLAGSNKWFVADKNQAMTELQQRVIDGDLHPTGGLFGDGDLPTQSQANALENHIVDKYQAWCNGLANNRVQQDRRALRLMPQQLHWTFEHTEDNTGNNVLNLKVSFTLAAGSFATIVLREVLQATESKVTVNR